MKEVKGTKKYHKRRLQKRFLIFLFFLALICLISFLFYLIFFQKKTLYLSPLALDSNSSTSKIEDSLRKTQIDFKNLKIVSDSYVINTSSGEIILSKNKDINKQLASLQLIIARLKIEGKSFKRIDFRFDKPIIAF